MTADFTAVRTRPVALGLVILPHLLLAGLLLGETVLREESGGGERIEIVFITPAVRPVSTPILKPVQPDLSAAANPAPIHKPRRLAEVDQDAPPSSAAETAATPVQAENKTATTVIDTAALIGMAGKIDREVRPPGENLLSAPEGKTLRKRLDEAFAAAHLAVPPKWYEAARIELFSAENDPAKIYQVKTAFGTYCLFYADRVKNPDAPSQPTISSCPRRF